MKDKIKTEYFRRVKKLVKLELYARNIIMGINWWVLGLVRLLIGLEEILSYRIGREKKY